MPGEGSGRVALPILFLAHRLHRSQPRHLLESPLSVIAVSFRRPGRHRSEGECKMSEFIESSAS